MRNIPASLRMLAHALDKASREHGRPNTFSCGELRKLYGGPNPGHAGRVGMWSYLALDRLLREEHNWKGSAPRYFGGRFYV